MKTLMILLTVLTLSFSANAMNKDSLDTKKGYPTNQTKKDINGNTYSMQDVVLLTASSEILGIKDPIILNCNSAIKSSCQIECEKYEENISIFLHGTDPNGYKYNFIKKQDGRFIIIKEAGECYYRGFTPVSPHHDSTID